MPLSCDRVLTFTPRTHRRNVGWSQGKRRDVLWPVYGWNVVTPTSRTHRLNLLQRAVLRLQRAGVREYGRAADLLCLHGDLIALVADELMDLGALDSNGVTEHGIALLDEHDIVYGQVQTGWVFQDTWTGMLLPRFVPNAMLRYMEIDGVNGDHTVRLRTGTKGAPRIYPATVVSPGEAHAIPPTAREVLAAARRHKRHEKQLDRAGVADLEHVPPEAIEQVSWISPTHTLFHLFTFAYVPDSDVDAEPWYVADPFGYGASEPMREQLLSMRTPAAQGVIRLLTGADRPQEQQRVASWKEMQKMICDDADEALERVEQQRDEVIAWRDDSIRDRLKAAYEDIIRLENHSRAAGVVDRIDSPYLRLRQAIEKTMAVLQHLHPPRHAWRKLFSQDTPSPRDSREQTIAMCARVCGFVPQVPQALLRANPAKVRAICIYEDGWNLRPQCTAMLLAASEVSGHPLRRLGKKSPDWLQRFDSIAAAAGGEVHPGAGKGSLERLKEDAKATVHLCADLLSVLGNA